MMGDMSTDDDTAVNDPDDDSYYGLTPNQVIAMNLFVARAKRGLTQEDVGERLERYLGTKWSKASVSAAERSAMHGHRQRNFSADEIVALARVFELPIAWFFIPPTRGHAVGRLPLVQTPDVGEGKGYPPSVAVEWTLLNAEDLMERLAEVVADTPDELTPEWQQHVKGAVHAARDVAIHEAVHDLDVWRDELRRLADQLDKAKRATLDGIYDGGPPEQQSAQ